MSESNCIEPTVNDYFHSTSHTGISFPSLRQKSHLFFNWTSFTFSSPSSTTTNSSPVCSSGTPGCEAFVTLCAFGSPVWKKLAKAPA